MRKGKSRSPPKLSNGRLLLILACLLTTCKNTDSHGCVSIYFTLYYLGACWYFPNCQNKKSQSTNLSKIERNEVNTMEMKYVVPDMAQSFGTLEFAGESEPIFERDKNNRRVLARRSYNLYSDVQKGENVVVEIPVQAGEKKFKYEQKVKLVNPKLYGRGYAIGNMGHTDYVLLADDIVAVEEK